MRGTRRRGTSIFGSAVGADAGSVSRDTMRLVAFSDAVFAITVTLLGAWLPVLGVAVIVAFNAFYWLPIRGESPRA